MSDWRVATEEPQTQQEPMKSDWHEVPFQDNKESFLQKLPRNIISGLAQGGHELLNTPSDLAKVIEKQGNEFGNLNNYIFEKYGIPKPKYNSSLADMIPRQDEHNFAEMLGQKGEPTFADKAIQNISQYLPEILGAYHFSPHLTRWGASRKLNRARELGQHRNMGPLNIDPNLIEDTRQFLPNTLPYRNSINEANTGNYNSLFNLQSDVGKHSGDYARSLFSAAERSHGRAGLQSRDRLLDAIHNELQSNGNLDISDLLREGRNEYRKYMRFRPYRNALLLGAAGLAVPKNPVTNLAKKVLLHNNQ